MKKTKFYALLGGVGILAASIFLIAADHIDSPSVANSTSDIADLYAFEGDNPNNCIYVLILTH